MMRVLVVGPARQGKARYAEMALGVGETWDPAAGSVRALHLWVEELMRRGVSPGECILESLDRLPGWVVVCDEVGCGVVPADAFARRWRDEVGALCVELAGRADRVERVFCGIPQRLKG